MYIIAGNNIGHYRLALHDGITKTISWLEKQLLDSFFKGFFNIIIYVEYIKKNSYSYLSIFFFKYASIAASGIATISAFIMTILTILHLVFVYITNCFPANSLESSCICSFDNSSIVSTNETTTTPFVPFLLPESYHYIDLTCSEIDNLLKFVLIIVCSANFLSIATNGIYLLLHWNSRNHNYHTFIYSKVQTNNNSTYNDLSVPVTS